MPGPWRVVITDSESLTGVASCAEHPLAPLDACDDCYVVETYSESVAAYSAAVGPLVGLALADLFDRFAVEWGRIEAPALQDLVGDHPLLALARQILAEPADDPEPVGRPVETVHLPVLGDSS